MLSLLSGAAMGLLGATIAGVLGATWGQVFLTYVVIGVVMTVASGLVMARHAQSTGDYDNSPVLRDGNEVHGFDQVTGSDRIN